jgi:hypothetical protein
MIEKSKAAFTGLGFDSDLIHKIAIQSLSLSGLKGISYKGLLTIGFSETEAKLIRFKVNRQPIPKDTIQRILTTSGGICCYCADGISTRPYQIHHIEEYATSQNHDERNLLLVCPNHHVAIHDKCISGEEQVARKIAWQNLWSIALSYGHRGVPFPFGAFDYLDYNVPGEITEIFSFGQPKPSLCIELSKGLFLNNALAVLLKENRLILSGRPGSGKSTAAVGIAGSLLGFKVFNYTTSDKPSIDLAAEILSFIEIAQQQLVLIVDDANTRLMPQQIEKILQAVTSTKKIMVVNTRSTLSSQQDFEQKFPNAVVPISWVSVKEYVKANLICNEATIVDYLKNNGLGNFFGNKIGYSVIDRRLAHVLEHYAKGTDTVWQFIFMLASGETKMQSIYTELYANDRLDLVVLFVGIKQISKVEQGISISEITEFYARHSKLKKSAPPTQEWLHETLNDLIKSRILINNRGRYILIHRLFAVNFLNVCYLRSPTDTCEILDTIFYDRSIVREMLILWSWMRDVEARLYVKQWQEKQTISDWVAIGNSAAAESLFSLQLLCYHLHPSYETILHAILKDKARIIAGFINQDNDGNLYYFSSLATAIRYNCPKIWKELLAEINIVPFVNNIKKAEPWMFQSLQMLFYSIAEKEPEWIANLSAKFTQADFDCIIHRVEKGNVKELCEVIEFQRHYIHNIKKSQLVAYACKIGELIKDCPLVKLEFPFFFDGIWDLLGYPDEIDRMFSTLNLETLAKELVQATPQYWENLAAISHMAMYGNKPIIQELLEKVNTKELLNNVKLFYFDYKHEFRVLLYQLECASSNKKKEFAAALRPLVKHAVDVNPDTKAIAFGDILEAFSFMDEDSAHELAVEMGINLAEVKQDHEPPTDYQKILADIPAKETTGEDYEIYAYKIKPPE